MKTTIKLPVSVDDDTTPTDVVVSDANGNVAFLVPFAAEAAGDEQRARDDAAWLVAVVNGSPTV